MMRCVGVLILNLPGAERKWPTSGLTPAPVVLRERSAYRASWPLGKTVVETEPKSKAAREMSELKDWVLAQLQVCTPETAQKREMADG